MAKSKVKLPIGVRITIGVRFVSAVIDAIRKTDSGIRDALADDNNISPDEAKTIAAAVCGEFAHDLADIIVGLKVRN